MTDSVFSRLCDLTDELSRLEYRMEHGAVQLALAELITRFDTLIDDTVELEAAHIDGAQERTGNDEPYRPAPPSQ